MARPKTVAVIGAGPSGLITVKTLLRNFPPGTFQPVIFERKKRIGGLWAVYYPESRETPAPGDSDWVSGSCPRPNSQNSQTFGKGNHGSNTKRAYVDPWLRTNLSRFSVAFSDLSWEKALGTTGVPDFPCAWEVRKYLEKYAETYIPDNCIKLGSSVLRAERRKSGGWVVSYSENDREETFLQEKGGQKVYEEAFDFLVVTSGHFGTPHIPHIPGLDTFSNKMHSSELQNPEDIDNLLKKGPRDGKLVVVGGSMSGVEAATSLALHVSSMKTNASDQATNECEVWHIATGPFWVLPRYLPHQFLNDTEEKKTPFVPLDLSLYDLRNRPPGMKGITFGPVTAAQVNKKNQFFNSLLGEEYSKVGGVNHRDSQENKSQRPPWVAISDHYAEFVRSGVVNSVTGRAVSVTATELGQKSVNIQTPAGIEALDGVSAIIMATGFKPSNSLSFLPDDILSTLEYSPEDDFLPLILDSWSTAHSEIPELGFVGFYRGAFWGPAELQAQSLANAWATTQPDSGLPVPLSAEEKNERAAERQRVRDYRDFRPTTARGQFPLGDYVGLMETISERLNRSRLSVQMQDGVGPDVQAIGPVIPARYPSAERGPSQGQEEVEITLKSLREMLLTDLSESSSGTTAAVFRALHGQWEFEREISFDEVKSTGLATFHPRYSSNPDFQAEYLYEEVDNTSSTRSVYRMRETSRPQQAGICVWSVAEAGSSFAAELLFELFITPTGRRTDPGKILVEGTSSNSSSQERHTYEFYFDRVAITHWSHCVNYPGDRSRSTRYSRVKL